MIPESSIAFLDDGTAWLAIFGGWCSDLDRPCDTCEGARWDWKQCADDDRQVDDPVDEYPCPDCINGRHTFEIEVGCRHCWHWSSVVQGDACCACHVPYTVEDGYASYEVSVVPGMILPLVAVDRHNTVGHYIVQTQPSGRWWEVDNSSLPVKSNREPIPLPSDAEPGGFAVQLRVQR